MYFDKEPVIEEIDQCHDCVFHVLEVACPLVGALKTGFVHLSGDDYVADCGFYQKHQRHLRIV